MFAEVVQGHILNKSIYTPVCVPQRTRFKKRGWAQAPACCEESTHGLCHIVVQCQCQSGRGTSGSRYRVFEGSGFVQDTQGYPIETPVGARGDQFFPCCSQYAMTAFAFDS